MISLQKHLKISKSESGVSLLEMMVVVAILGVLSLILYDLNLSILTSNLFIDAKNELSLQGQHALDQIKGRLTSSYLILADRYNQTTSTWTEIGSYYTDPGIIDTTVNNPGYPAYPALPTLRAGNLNPSGDYVNVIARIPSRTIGSQTQLVTALVPASQAQASTGIAAASVGNSILFIESRPARKVCHQWAYQNPPTPTTNYLIDTYRLNYYYLSRNSNTPPVAGKNYYVDLIQWESIDFADYNQILQVMNHIKLTPPPQNQNAESGADIITQLTNPSTVSVNASCTSYFASERKKDALQYAWNASRAATNITGNASIQANFYNLVYNNSFDPNSNQQSNTVPLTLVTSSFKIPMSKAISLLPSLVTGSTQGRAPYTIAFNNDSNVSAGFASSALISKGIPHLVPIRFNPFDTTGYADDQFMGGFEVAVVSNTTVGYQVNMRLVLMADSQGILRRMISNETVVLATTRG
jgi:prepilin-type N-terminal cleavage/methylation domain-containing protein